MAAVDEALTWNWVDPARLGAIGGSYGGYMTSWLAGHTQRFAGIITERVVTDRYSYFGTTDMGFFGLSRTYGGPPWEREEKYYFHSPIRYVKNMTTPMLIVHGEQDLRHTMEQAEQLFTFLKRLGRPVEFVRFHSSGWGEDQNLSAAGRPNNRLARYRIILEWLGRHLGGAGERKEETPWKQASAR